MTEFNTSWLKQAFFLAEKAASEDEVPVGAIVVKGDRVIGEGYNRREQLQDPVAHAEILAIQEASRHLGSWRLNDCVLVVTLEPCPMCLAACQQARLSQVFFGTADPKGGALSLGYSLHSDLRTHHRFPLIGLHSEECGKILTEFFAKKRRLSI